MIEHIHVMDRMQPVFFHAVLPNSFWLKSRSQVAVVYVPQNSLLGGQSEPLPLFFTTSWGIHPNILKNLLKCTGHFVQDYLFWQRNVPNAVNSCADIHLCPILELYSSGDKLRIVAMAWWNLIKQEQNDFWCTGSGKSGPRKTFR